MNKDKRANNKIEVRRSRCRGKRRRTNEIRCHVRQFENKNYQNLKNQLKKRVARILKLLGFSFSFLLLFVITFLHFSSVNHL